MTTIEELLKESIAQVCGVDASRLSSDSTLEDVGIDSLASAEVLVDLEIRLGRNLPSGVLRRLGEVDTIGKLSALLEEAFATTAAGRAQ